MKYFLTGATGSIGSELYKELTQSGQVIGCARNKPDWWREKDIFTIIDFSAGIQDHCLKYIDAETTIIHTLNLAHEDANIDLDNTIKLYKKASQCGARSFIYISSIRVYSGLFGEVDEKTNPVPQPGDLYGCAKLRAEQTLIQLSAHTKTPLRICRIGSVFSVMSPRKIPTPLRKLSRWVDKGMNTHLISARNVAQAIYYIANHPDPNPGETYNITQEIEGENDYMKLGDLLHGVQKPHSAYKTYMPVNWIRNLYKHFHGTSIAMPYITVKESKLSNEKFQYHTDLLTSLQETKDMI